MFIPHCIQNEVPIRVAANVNIVFDTPGLGCLISKGSAKLLFAGTVLGIDGYSA